MKKFTLLLLFMSAFTQAQRFDWVSTAGYSAVANSIQGAIAIARDSQGNIYTLNSANEQQICQGITADAIGSSTFLYKFNAAGVRQYTKVIGFSFAPLNIQIGENDNLYVLGSLLGTNSLIIGTETFVGVQDRNYIIKFDPTGALMWKNFNNGPLSQSPLLQFANNHVYFQSGNLSVGKMNTDGQVVANLTATSFASATSANSIFFKGSGVLSNGDLVFSAESRGTLTYGTTTLTQIGNPFLVSAVLTIRATENLNFVWANYTDGLRSPDQTHIPTAVGNDNGIYIGVQVINPLTVGLDMVTNSDSTSGLGTGGILKMDANGNKIWLKSTTGSAHPWTMLNNPDGSGILCAGQIFGFSALSFGSTTVNPINGNSFITKIDYNGVFQNSFAFGSGPGSFAKSLTTNNQGVFYVGGRTSSATPATFACIIPDARAGLYLGRFTEQPDTRAPKPSITVSGNTLTAIPDFSGTKQWFLNGNAISDANSQTLTIPQNGNYTVTYVLPDYTACVSTSPITTISNLGTADFESLNNAIKVFPNPTKGIVTISSDKNTIIDKIEIVDILGKTVSIKTKNTSQIDISEFSNGIYIFKIFAGEAIFQKKIIKQ
ncbi:T9SS type A sorting domain-containing protein [Flavobacterium luteum]|uniref:T9SS type A sorting domain-containing protein n=1 Tax=Flavobacterium luteum TaxID=2026654 RepID=A0A7J5AER6_9FLAO|nr:T9SS type A sorting domain-containing protein [Flavobacterium luteum]KAB1156062.1 T9SS type A sorting domain-containing protein [Flavobacterium luteum]